MSTPKRREIVTYVAQAQFTNGIEWSPWDDMVGPGTESENMYAAIGRIELYHHFMLHGRYPEPYNSTLEARQYMPMMREARNQVIEARKRDLFKVRTRVIKRTTVIVVTEEEADAPMIVEHGEPT